MPVVIAAHDDLDVSALAPARSHDPRLLELFIGFVVLGGVALLLVHAFTSAGTSTVARRPLEIALFGMLVVLCELRPLRMSRNGSIDEIVASTTFVFAVLLAFGPAPAMVVQAVASVVADAAARKAFQRTLFNVGQYWLSWGASGAVFVLISKNTELGSGGLWSPAELAALSAAAVTYFLMNSALVGAVIAIHSGQPIARTARLAIQSQARHDWVLLALAPIVVVVAERSLVLLPLLLLPVFAVWRSAAITIEKEHQAWHDSLTNMPNRLLFGSRLTDGLAAASRKQSVAAVLLIDLDRFKEVNDTLGHQAGDELLRAIGPRIQTAVPDDSTVARLGGDEFAVLLNSISAPVEATAIAEAIVEALRQPFTVDHFRLDIEASIGVALYPAHGADADALLQRADVAMYVAKETSRGVELYDPAKDRNSRRRLSLLGDLREALVAGELELHYQPKVELTTGHLRGCEALLRWTHPTHGPVPPAEFIPLAEHTGLIRPLTSFVLAEAVSQIRVWLDAGLDIPVAVNLSARNLHDSHLANEVADLLDRLQVPASYLHLEITESSVMAEPARAERTLRALHGMGIRIAIDDFGTGYSSLAYLQRLPVDELKVDKSFVINMGHNNGAHVIVRSTIDLARNLGLEVTAEGVETPRALALLRAARCDAVQGYLISRPLAAPALEAWVREHLDGAGVWVSPTEPPLLRIADGPARQRLA